MPGLSDYPAWLPQMLFVVRSYEDWQASQPVDLPTFLDKHNLHDSLWYGLWIWPNFHATVVIRWDTVQAVSQYPDLFPREDWMDWPILLIDFQAPPYQILFDNNDWEPDFRPVISHSYSQIVAMEDRERFLDSALSQSFLSDNVKQFWLEKTLHHTILEGAASEIHIFHAPEVRLLCKSFDGEVLRIPGL